MRITVVSRSWPSNEHSGVTMVAAEHVRILADAGDNVTIIGSHPAVLQETLPVSQCFYVPVRRFGGRYAPARVDRGHLADALRQSRPDVVVLEAWQTPLTDAAVETASSLGMPTLMVSHGVAVHAFTSRLTDVLRTLRWAPYYRNFTLPRLLSRLSVLTALDMTAISPRFYDRDLARRLGVPVVPLANAPANWSADYQSHDQRKPQILVIGYYSPVKNQLRVLEIAARLPAELQFLFVGSRQGTYFAQCKWRASELGLGGRVIFREDHECNLAEEVARSLVVLMPSLTEVLPLTLLEAMASGTPFVATPVGAVPSLRGGLLAGDVAGLRDAILSLANDARLWQRCSSDGRRQQAERYSREQVAVQLCNAVAAAMHEGSRT